MSTSAQPIDEVRPVVFSRRTRKQLEGIAAALQRRRYLKDAEAVRELVQSWDGAADFVVVHRGALQGRPDPEGEQT